MTELLRILHLEDSLADADLIAHQLKKAGLDFVLTRVETRNQFLEKLEAFKPEIILADCKLPDFDGLTSPNYSQGALSLDAFYLRCRHYGGRCCHRNAKKWCR